MTSGAGTHLTKTYPVRSSPASGGSKKPLQRLYWQVRTGCPSSLHQKQMSKSIWVAAWIFLKWIELFYIQVTCTLHMYSFERSHAKLLLLLPKPPKWDLRYFFRLTTYGVEGGNNHRTKLGPQTRTRAARQHWWTLLTVSPALGWALVLAPRRRR